jgi:hypothetical protein
MWQSFQTVLEASWRQFAGQVGEMLPNLLASLLIVAVGVVLGLIAGTVARWILVAAQADRAAARLGIGETLGAVGVPSVARLVARLVRWGVIAVAFIPALYSLDARVASDLVGRTLVYLPHVVVALALLWFAMLLSRFLGRGVLIAAVNWQMPSARVLAALTRIGVMLVAVAVALEDLGIGRATALTAFAILFGGVTLAAALAVGLGAQDLVRRWLAQWPRSADEAEERDPLRHL